MNKIKKLFDNKIILYMLLISPIIDVITGFMVMNNISLTLGLIVKPIQIFLAIGYLILCDKKQFKFNVFYIFLLIIYSIVSILNNYDIFLISKIEYLSYIIKYNYFAIMIIYFYRYLILNPNINIKVLKIPLLFFVATILLSTITNTAFRTYPVRLGFSSWYFSGNEYSSYLSVLYPFVIYIFLDRGKNSIFNIIVFLIFAYAMLISGTKATIISFWGCSMFYILYRLLLVKKYKLNLSFLIVLVVFVSSLILIKSLPVIKNIKIHSDHFAESGEKISEKDEVTEIILSERDQYYKRIKSYSRDSNDIYLGKAFLYKGHIDIIESDFLDMYFMYGIIGFLLIYGTFIYMFFKQIYNYIKKFKINFCDFKYTFALLSIGMSTLLSFVVGHTFSSPSVALYIAFILSRINVIEGIETNEKNVVYLSSDNNKAKKYMRSIINNNNIVFVNINKPINNNLFNIIKHNIISLYNIFAYFVGKEKYYKSFIYFEKYDGLLIRLCFLSSMNSNLIISRKDWNLLSKRNKYYFENEYFQNVIYIEEEY